MIKNQSALLAEIDRFFQKTNTRWAYGNSVLYDMCAQKPCHTDSDVIAGKIWLIGRSYAASIERHKKRNGASVSTDEFYFDIVVPKMLSIGRELDEEITELNGYGKMTEDILDRALNTHKFLMDAFSEIVNQDDRSFTSKYLHFHCPSIFYIYDTRASQGVKRRISVDKERLYRHYPCGCDTEYAGFCMRMLELQEYIEEKYHKILRPRELDNLLLDF